MQTIIRQAGEASDGLCKNNMHTKNYNHGIFILSKKQKDLRIRIQNTKNTDQKFTLKTKRNKILHHIKERQIKLNNEEVNKKIEGIDASKNDHAMFNSLVTETARYAERLKIPCGRRPQALRDRL